MANVVRGGQWTCPVESGNVTERLDSCLDEDQSGSCDEGRCASAGTSAMHSAGDMQVQAVNPTLIALPSKYKSHRLLLRVLGAKNQTAVEDEDSISQGTSAESGDREDEGGSPELGIGDNLEVGTTCRFFAGSECGLTKAAQNIALVSVLGMPTGLSIPQKHVYLKHFFDADCELGFRCLGGLVGFIVKHGPVRSLGRVGDPKTFNAITYRNFMNCLRLPRGTMMALNMYNQEAHPLGYGSGNSKEGLSLYGILNRTKSCLGSDLLRLWVSCPSTDLQTITARQEFVALLRAPSSEGIISTFQQTLRGLKNVPSIVNRLQSVEGTLSDWQALDASGRALMKVVDAMKGFQSIEHRLSDTALCAAFVTANVRPVRETVQWIETVLDLRESKARKSVCVRSGFSEDIDELRECYAGLDEFLTQIGVSELQRLVQETDVRLPRLKVVYVMQVGYLVLLKHDDIGGQGATEDALEEAGFEFMFSTDDDGAYYKNERCYELDKDLGDIHGALVDLESKAVRYLECKVLPSASDFLELASCSAELDCLVALADVAQESNWVRPSFARDVEGIRIRHGKHPLQELVIPSFIPNSTHARRGDVHIVTGANSSGKSVYCKQVALIIILAQIGSCVPASECRLSLVDAIFTRIASQDSVSARQSSFYADSEQVAGMLRETTPRSLLVLDEWGKGTNCADGMALFAATISELLEKDQISAPICLAATHFSDVLKTPILPMQNPRLGVFSMEVLETDAAARTFSGDSVRVSTDLGRVVTYLYRIREGSMCSESRALLCAQDAGVPRDVLQRAAEVKEAMSSVVLLPGCTFSDSTSRVGRVLAAVSFFSRHQLEGDNDVATFLDTLPF